MSHAIYIYIYVAKRKPVQGQDMNTEERSQFKCRTCLRGTANSEILGHCCGEKEANSNVGHEYEEKKPVQRQDKITTKRKPV